MTDQIRLLMEQRARAVTSARALLDTAERESRDLTAEERQQYDGFDGEYDALTQRIGRLMTQEEREREQTAPLSGAANPARNRQPGSENSRGDTTDSAEYRAALIRYLYGGQTAGLRVDPRGGDVNGELRAILGASITGEGATGGVLAPAALERTLLAEVENQNVMRRLADVRTSNSDVEIPYTTTHTTAYLVGEGADFTASTPAWAKLTMKAYKVGALSYVTVEALQDMLLDVENWLRDDFARAFATLEETHFISGAGSSASPATPEGVITGATLGKTAAAATAFTSDELLDLMYSLNATYRSRGVWLMNDTTLVKLRKLKTGDGQYLWQPGMTDGQPDRLLGHALYTSDQMPAATTGLKPILFGDFKRYRVLDRRGLYVQRLNEIQALSGQVAFLAYRRYDAKLLNSAAIKYLQMA